MDEYASIMKSDRSKGTNISTSDSSDWLINEQRQISPDNPTTSTKIMQTSTPNRPSGPLLEERSERTLLDEQVAGLEEPSWSEAAQQRLLESEKQGVINKNYKQLEPLVESPNSSWGEIAQQRLFESELTGKGYRKHPKSTPSTPERPSGSSLEERNTTRVGQWINIAEPPSTPERPSVPSLEERGIHKGKQWINIAEQPSTPERPSVPSLEERKTPKSKAETRKELIFKNVGFVNRKWTEIVVEDEEECEQLERDKVKEAIIQLSQRELHNPIYEWLEKCIRVKHKTYVPVEVNKDYNGRMIDTPIKPTNKPEISFGAEIRTPKDSDDEDTDEEITEVEYPQPRLSEADVRNPDVKVKVDIKIINKKDQISWDKSCHMYQSLLSKQELIKLINDEIKLDA